MSDNALLKNNIHPELVQQIADGIRRTYPDFDHETFTSTILADLETLELKERVALIARTMRTCLPQDYPQAIALLLTLLPDEKGTYQDGMFSDNWHIWTIAHFVQEYGLDHFEESVHAMYEITKRWSSEFAIRPYLTRYPERLLPILHTWTQDDNEHVRRLVSEGTRTRLPWASRLPQFIDDPAPVIALLEKLKDDPALYVRRSVANNLNDLSKDHPQMVVDLLAQWAEEADDNRQWVIRHALRTLVKKGHPGALQVLGFGPAQVTLTNLTITPPSIAMGDEIVVSGTITGTTDEAQDLMIDYIVHFMKKNGSTSPKVFKLKTVTLPPGESLTFRKKQSFKPINTRRYYPGTHRIEIQINGDIIAGVDFEVTA